MSIERALKTSYPAEVVDALIAAYVEIESNFSLRKWKASELDAGHFVEAARRCLDHKLFSSYVPIGKSLPNFTDSVLSKYESAQGEESLRMLIPRVLKSIYNVRNKRGVGHLGLVSPNEMDSTLILYSVKWVLAELTRLSSGLDPAETQRAVDQIIERRVPALWKHDGPTRVLLQGVTAKEKVLVLLYDSSPQAESALAASIEYKNGSDFRKLLRALHTARLIEFQADKSCASTPKGMLAAEAVLLAATTGSASDKGPTKSSSGRSHLRRARR